MSIPYSPDGVGKSTIALWEFLLARSASCNISASNQETWCAGIDRQVQRSHQTMHPLEFLEFGNP